MVPNGFNVKNELLQKKNSQKIRVLSSQTIGYFLKNIFINFLTSNAWQALAFCLLDNVGKVTDRVYKANMQQKVKRRRMILKLGDKMR